MKKVIKILKDVQSYEIGKNYRVHGSFANSLIKRGKAEELLPIVKEEKKVIETKEEKHAPAETKELLPIKKLAEVISGYTDDQLLEIIKSDERITAKRMATEEIKKRE